MSNWSYKVGSLAYPLLSEMCLRFNPERSPRSKVAPYDGGVTWVTAERFLESFPTGNNQGNGSLKRNLRCVHGNGSFQASRDRGRSRFPRVAPPEWPGNRSGSAIPTLASLIESGL